MYYRYTIFTIYTIYALYIHIYYMDIYLYIYMYIYKFTSKCHSRTSPSSERSYVHIYLLYIIEVNYAINRIHEKLSDQTCLHK